MFGLNFGLHVLLHTKNALVQHSPNEKELLRSFQHFSKQEPKPSDADSTQNAGVNGPDDVPMVDGESASAVSVPEDPSEKLYAERLSKIKGILSGETSIQLTLQFLYRHNKGLAMGIALTVYEKEEEADTLIRGIDESRSFLQV